jgi:hypothetical protein
MEGAGHDIHLVAVSIPFRPGTHTGPNLPNFGSFSERLQGSLARQDFSGDQNFGNLGASFPMVFRAVAVCTTVIASQDAHEAGVETLAAYRGRGFAADVLAAWACAVRKLGAAPLYATTFDNISSQRVALRLRLSPVASEFSVHCQLIS